MGKREKAFEHGSTQLIEDRADEYAAYLTRDPELPIELPEGVQVLHILAREGRLPPSAG